MGSGAPAAPPRGPRPRSFGPRRGGHKKLLRMNRRHKQPSPPPRTNRRSPPPPAGSYRWSSPPQTATNSCWERLHRNRPRLVPTFRIPRLSRLTDVLLFMFRTKPLHLNLVATTTMRRRRMMSTSMTTSTLAPAWMVCTCLLWMKNPSATTAVNLLVPLHAHNAWPSPTRLRMPAIIKLNRVTFSALTH